MIPSTTPFETNYTTSSLPGNLRQMDLGGDPRGILHPPPLPFLVLFSDPFPKELLKQEVQFLLILVVIELVPHEFIGGRFYSSYLLVLKRRRGWRLTQEGRKWKPEYLYPFTVLQDGDISHYNPIPRSGRLVCHPQPSGHLLSCSLSTHPTNISYVS